MLSRIFRKIKSSVLSRLGKTSYYEGVWERRSASDVEQYLSNHDMPSRAWLTNIIKSATDVCDISSPKVLELGCGWGANLYVLGKLLPQDSELVGIDISPASINAGREQLEELNCNNITLHLGRADDLKRFSDSQFDVVFVDAVLMYIADDKIEKVIREMARVSKTLIFILELSLDNNKVEGIHSRDGWVRNYHYIIKNSSLKCDIAAYEVTEAIRSSGRWPSQGKLLKLFSGTEFK